MSTAVKGRVSDTGTWMKGCFSVRVGTDFKTYKEILEYSMQDETFPGGTLAKPVIPASVKSVLAGGGSDDPLPIYYSKRKCRDTSLGGNDAINPLPQFCVDDDIAHDHYSSELESTVSMGQVYSENYDDTQQILYLGFGTPVFTDLGSFWGTAADMDMANFVNKGSGITAEKIGYLLGSTPIRIIKIATIPYQFIATILDNLENVPITKYYAFSSQMPMYFRFVNSILVTLATNMDLMGSDPPNNTTGSPTTSATSIDLVTGGNTDDLSGMGTIFRDRGLDIAKIVTKRFLYEYGMNHEVGQRNTDQALFANAAANNGTGNSTGSVASDTATSTPTDGSVATPTGNWQRNWINSWEAAYGATFYDAHLYMGFRVEKGGQANESFSNTTGESQISQLANSKFQESRDISFGTAGGNFGDSVFGDIVSTVAEGVTGFLKGALGTLSLDALGAAATGASRIEIPEVWTNSTFSRSSSFTLNLMAPYGDYETIFQTLYVPLACVLAGSLPRATGHSSYSAPFICQAYCRGVFSSPLAMVESLDISRGADQFGFNFARLPLDITIHLTLKDLSPVMSMNMGGDKGIAEQLIGSEDSFQEYMLTLAGMGLRERLAPYKSLRRKASILLTTLFRNKTSPYLVGMDSGRLLASRVVSTIVSGGRGLPTN